MGQKLSNWLVLWNSLVLLCGIAAPKPSLACSCRPSTPASNWRQADVVFTGQVMMRQVVTPTSDRPPLVRWTFLVSQVSKGTLPRRVQVYSGISTASCGTHFQIGGDYRVYAQRDRQTLSTHLCAGNEAISKKKQQPHE